MGTTSDFPVPAETVIPITCYAGHELSGDNTVTCIQNTEFQFSVQPTCG